MKKTTIIIILSFFSILLLSLVWSIKMPLAARNYASDQELLKVWSLLIYYKTGDKSHFASIEDDPKMQEIWTLRGIQLKYFIEFAEAIRILDEGIAAPSGSEQIVVTPEERTLLLTKIGEVAFEGKEANNITLSDTSRQYFYGLLEIVQAISNGIGDQYFTNDFIVFRSAMLRFIEEENVQIGNYTLEEFEKFEKYLDEETEREQSTNSTSNSTESQLASCPVVGPNTYAVKASFSGGNGGSSWYEASQQSGGDCDYYVKYFTGGADWMKVRGTDTDTQCTINLMGGGFSAYLFPNFKHVIYGKNRASICFATGYDLLTKTKIKS
jgi:hypothetical protein